MGINLNQNNEYGDNNAQFSQSGNNVKITNKLILKSRQEGFVIGVIMSIFANFISDYLF